MKKNTYTESVAKAQKKYGAGLRQFKFALQKEKDSSIINMLESVPNLKQWITAEILRKRQMKIKILNIPGGKRIVKGKYADMIDLDYSQSLEDLEKDLTFVLPTLLENLSLFDQIAARGSYRVYRGSHHLDIVNDGVGSEEWLTIEDHIDID